MVVVGIDIASQKHDYFMIQKDTGTVFSSSSVTIPNSEQGYKKLHADILAFSGAVGDSDIRIGLESTGIYHTNIIAFLIAHDFQVMMINPILTNMARKADKVHSPKNDNLDSQTICKYMIDHSDKFSPYTSTLYHKQTLKSLSRKRFFIVEELRKAKIAVNNLVQIIFPELKSLFSNIYGSSAIAVLKEYSTPQKLAKAHASKVASLLHGRCKCSASDIIEAAKHSVGISDDCYAFELMDAIENMEHIQKRIDKYDARIKELVDELCPNLLTVPGISYTTAGLISGEIGDAGRFHSILLKVLFRSAVLMLLFTNRESTKPNICCLQKKALDICDMHFFKSQELFGSTILFLMLTTKRNNLRVNITMLFLGIFRKSFAVSFFPL